MWISKRSYEDLLAAHKREVDILAAWVESLQFSQGQPPMTGRPDAPALTDLPNMSMYISAEEEDLIDAHAQGIIDDMQFQQGMDELGRTKVEIG